MLKIFGFCILYKIRDQSIVERMPFWNKKKPQEEKDSDPIWDTKLSAGHERKQREFLEKVTVNDVNFFSLDNYECWAKVVSQYDGDTFTAVFFIEDKPLKFKIRLAGIDTAEKRSSSLAEKAHANKARERLKELIDDKLIWLKCEGADKYGRILAAAYRDSTGGKSFNDILVEERLAYVYDGGTKVSFEEWAPQEAQN